MARQGFVRKHHAPGARAIRSSLIQHMQIRVNASVPAIEPLPIEAPLPDHPDLSASEATQWARWPPPDLSPGGAKSATPFDTTAGDADPTLVGYGSQVAQDLGLDAASYTVAELAELARQQLTEHLLSGHAEELLPHLGPPTRQALARALLLDIGLDPDRRVDVPMPVDPENPLAPESQSALDYYLRRDALTLEDIRYMSARPITTDEARRRLGGLPPSLAAEFDARFGAYAAALAAQACTLLGAWIAAVADQHGIDLAKTPISLSRVKLRCQTTEVDVNNVTAVEYQKTRAEVPGAGYFVTLGSGSAQQRFFLSLKTGTAEALPAGVPVFAWIAEHRQDVFNAPEVDAAMRQHDRMSATPVLEGLGAGRHGFMDAWLTPQLRADIDRGREAAHGQTDGEAATSAFIDCLIPFRGMVTAFRKGDMRAAYHQCLISVMDMLTLAASAVAPAVKMLPLARLAGATARTGVASAAHTAARMIGLRDTVRAGLKNITPTMRGSMASLRPVVSERMVAELQETHTRLASALDRVLRQAQGPTFRSGWWRLDGGSAGVAADAITPLVPVAARGKDGTRMAVLPYGEGGGYTPYDIALDKRVGPVMLADRAGWLYETLPVATLERYRVQSGELLHALGTRRAGADGTIMYQQRRYARIGADYLELAWDPAVSTAERAVWRAVPPEGVRPDLVFHRLVYDAEKSLWRRALTGGLRGGVGEEGASTSRAGARTPTPAAGKIDRGLEDRLNARIPNDLPYSRDAYTDHFGQWHSPTGRIADSETVRVSRQLLAEMTDTTTQIGWHQHFADYFDVQLPRATAGSAAAAPATAARQESAVAMLSNLLRRLETTSPTFRGLVNHAIEQGRLGTAVNTRWTLILTEPRGTRHGMAVYAESFSTGTRTSYIPDPAAGHMADRYYIGVDGRLRPMSATRQILINVVAMLTGQRSWSTSRHWLPQNGVPPHSLQWTGLGERGATFYLMDRISRESRLGQWSLLSDARFSDQHVAIGARGTETLPDIRFNVGASRLLQQAGGVDAMRLYVTLQNNYLESLFPLKLAHAAPAAETITLRGVVVRNRIPAGILSGRRPYVLDGVRHHPGAEVSKTETVVAARRVLERATDPTEHADLLADFDRYFDIGVSAGRKSAFIKNDPALRHPVAWQDFTARMAEQIRDFIKQLYRGSETFRRIVNGAVRARPVTGPDNPRWRVAIPRWLVEIRLPDQIAIRSGVDHYTGELAGNSAARHAAVPYPFGGRIGTGSYFLTADGTVATRDVQHETVRGLLQMFTGASDPSVQAWTRNGVLRPEILLTHGAGERGGLELLAQRVLKETGRDHAPIVSLLPFPRKQVKLTRMAPDEPHLDFTSGTLAYEPARTLEQAGGVGGVNEYVALQDRYLDALFPTGDAAAWGNGPGLALGSGPA
ncbi:hypothetical protein BOSP111201_00615 [Bordetella sputigena]